MKIPAWRRHGITSAPEERAFHQRKQQMQKLHRGNTCFAWSECSRDNGRGSSRDRSWMKLVPKGYCKNNGLYSKNNAELFKRFIFLIISK